MERPSTHFAQATGARIAYQVFGTGPSRILGVPPTAQNIELAWERPEIRLMFEQFGAFAEWAIFDKRGTGASDRRSHMPGLDERMHDLEAVMDAVGWERAFLHGASEGGPMCILFAVTYPERVEGLILHGSGPYTSPPNQNATERAAARERHAKAAQEWGTESSRFAKHFAPSMADDEEFLEWHQRYERFAADSSSLQELLDISLDIDVTELLSSVNVPTLIIHRLEDPVVPIAYGRAAAEGIRGSEFVELQGRDHFAYSGGFEYMEPLERFVTGTVASRPPVLHLERDVEIRTMGGFAVLVDGNEVPTSEWGSRLARQLTKRLVLARGWPVRREQLFDQLWPGVNDIGRLGSRLSVELSAVRRVLRGAIVADRQTIALDLSRVSTDIETFYANDEDDDIVDAYSGELLPEEVAEDWSRPARDEARSRFASSARRLAHRASGLADHERAGFLARRLIEADQFDEDAHRLLVASSLAGGEKSSARRAHEVWTRMGAELEINVPSFAEVCAEHSP